MWTVFIHLLIVQPFLCDFLHVLHHNNKYQTDPFTWAQGPSWPLIKGMVRCFEIHACLCSYPESDEKISISFIFAVQYRERSRECLALLSKKTGRKWQCLNQTTPLGWDSRCWMKQWLQNYHISGQITEHSNPNCGTPKTESVSKVSATVQDTLSIQVCKQIGYK